jgi:hypothetical protein
MLCNGTSALKQAQAHDVVGEAAYNNWRCYTGTPDNPHPFNFEQACQWAYGLNAVHAHPLDADDAFTWVCYSTQHT